MISSKKRQSGFTIVELLIVIVVIGILATLVLVTFTGIQKKARDSQRQTDINAVNSQLEAFYAQNSYYPSTADLDNATWVKANLKGLDPESLLAPNSTTPISSSTTSATTYYNYVPNNCTAGTASDPTTNACDGYTLTAKLESGSDFSKSSNT